MLKKEFLTKEEINNGNLLELKTEMNGKKAHVLIEDKDGIIFANLYIWGPAYESYFLIGNFGYCDKKLFEEWIEEDVAELKK